MEERFEGLALCALGLEKVLRNEVERIGLDYRGQTPGRVAFSATMRELFRANLELRTAERILLVAARHRAADFDALFETARRPEWRRFVAKGERPVIERVRSHGSQLSAQTAVQSVVHKAVCETLCKAWGLARLPEEGPSRSLRVYLEDDECLIGLDLSGEALHKRGWRKDAGAAPLKETIAAGFLLMAGWRRRRPLIDPLCGSGTFLVEAAHFAMDRAPGLDRRFALETMPAGLEARAGFAEERARAAAAVRADSDFLIIGCDSDPGAVAAARSNAARAGVGPMLRVEVGRAEELAPPAEDGLLMTNPPWGQRLGADGEAAALAARLGNAWGLVVPSKGGGAAREARARRESGEARGRDGRDGRDGRRGPARQAPPPRSGPWAAWDIGIVDNSGTGGLDFGRRPSTTKAIRNGAEELWFHLFKAGDEERRGGPHG